MIDVEKMEFILRAKVEMRDYLRSLSWEEKVASIQRMNEAGKVAREAMRKVREAEAALSGSVSSEVCDVKPLA